MENRCGTCNRCAEACPVQAIKGQNFVEYEPRDMRLDVLKCENYFKEMKSSNKLDVCGMCIYSCAYNKKDNRFPNSHKSGVR